MHGVLQARSVCRKKGVKLVCAAGAVAAGAVAAGAVAAAAGEGFDEGAVAAAAGEGFDEGACWILLLMILLHRVLSERLINCTAWMNDFDLWRRILCWNDE